jgi:DeoR family fructose operon transcriptional repressor
MFSEERQRRIMEQLRKDGRVVARKLAEQFQVSVDSIRRDLDTLEQQGLLKRTHGGAVLLSEVRLMPPAPEDRYAPAEPWEDAIAREAALRIERNMTVFIGGGRLHVLMIRHLPREFSFTVVTNSLRTADALRQLDHVDTYLVGGQVKPSGNITDSLSVQFLRQFSLDLFFATGGGFSGRGISTATPEVALAQREAARLARKVIALIPHTRFGVDAFALSLKPDELDLVITDRETLEEEIARITELGVEVLVAGE